MGSDGEGKAMEDRDERSGDDFVPTPLEGLSDAQVAERVAAGQVNVDSGPGERSVAAIVASHVLTLFNFVNLVLALLVLVTGSYRNLLFILIVLANLAIGIFQELRSRKAVERLRILAERPVTVVRGGEDRTVAPDAIVLGDLVRLAHGDQVPADMVVRQGRAALNESLLTGESTPQMKGEGDQLLSGSFVVSGALVAQARAVGAESFAATINDEARQARPVRSEIMETLRFIITLASWAILPIGVLLFLRTLADGATWDDSILTTVAAVLGMIPQGLVLLTSSVLAIATIRLSERNVLIQQLYCVETLARVDVLCLDKTGTITSGSMEVAAVRAAPGHDEGEVRELASLVARANADDANETSRAILQMDGGEDTGTFARAIPFSSERKYSGCVTSGGRSIVMGAAEFVLGSPLPDPVRAALPQSARILVVAEVDGFDGEGAILGVARLVGYVAIADQIRPSAHETLGYFQDQGVRLMVISGDDPRTVSAIAGEAGVPDAGRWVDATTLSDEAAIARAAATDAVFGRVTPQQKRSLVRALQAQGHVVAMTGDGVNDVLALREADCSVAMASGSDAARTVAEIVLVDDDFASMPHVVAEGRRSINNLQRSAALFLEKTVFSTVVALICIVLPPYPMLPIQLSLFSAAMIGIPSFVLALEPNHDRIRGRFLANVLCHAVPASAAISCGLLALVVLRDPMGLTSEQVSTLATALLTVVGTVLLVRISQPMNALRRVLVVAMAATMVGALTLFPGFFEVSPVTAPMGLVLVAISAVALVIFQALWGPGVAATEAGEGPYVLVARRVRARTDELFERRHHR